MGVYESGVEFKIVNMGGGAVSVDIYYEMNKVTEKDAVQLDENSGEEEQ